MAPLQSLLDTRSGTALSWTEMQVLPLKIQRRNKQYPFESEKTPILSTDAHARTSDYGKMWEDHCFSDPRVPFEHFFNPMLEIF